MNPSRRTALICQNSLISRIGPVCRISSPIQGPSSFAVGVADASPEPGARVLSLFCNPLLHQPAASRTDRSRFCAGRISRIGPIRRIRRIKRLIPPFSQASRRELFTVASFLDNGTFQRCNLLVQEVVSLVNQTDQRVCHNAWIVIFKPLGIPRPTPPVYFFGRIRRISPIRRIV